MTTENSEIISDLEYDAMRYDQQAENHEQQAKKLRTLAMRARKGAEYLVSRRA